MTEAEAGACPLFFVHLKEQKPSWVIRTSMTPLDLQCTLIFWAEFWLPGGSDSLLTLMVSRFSLCQIQLQHCIVQWSLCSLWPLALHHGFSVFKSLVQVPIQMGGHLWRTTTYVDFKFLSQLQVYFIFISAHKLLMFLTVSVTEADGLTQWFSWDAWLRDSMLRSALEPEIRSPGKETAVWLSVSQIWEPGEQTWGPYSLPL